MYGCRAGCGTGEKKVGRIGGLEITSWLVAAALVVACTVAHASQQALLIGVSHYPHLAGRSLEGPVNDLRLMRHMLQRLGFSDEQVHELSEAAGPAHWPTRQNVLDALAALDRKSQRGDWVVVYFAGHGSQVPQSATTRAAWPEADGFDEVFLTRDTTHWDARRQRVEGAIVDDEFAAVFDRLRRRGVRIWAVFDTCHADGMTRSHNQGDASSVLRFISPGDLGVALSGGTGRSAHPQASGERRVAHHRAQPRASAGGTQDVTRSVKIAFTAAQADEPAAEELFPDPLEPGTKRKFGVFTYQLYRASAGWTGSFGQLAEAVERAYQDRPFPTPRFSGNLQVKPPFVGPVKAAQH